MVFFMDCLIDLGLLQSFEYTQILIPIKMNTIPMNDCMFGICSRRPSAVSVVNRNVVDWVIGTANEMSEFCNANTYRMLPH